MGAGVGTGVGEEDGSVAVIVMLAVPGVVPRLMELTVTVKSRPVPCQFGIVCDWPPYSLAFK